jgi:Cd2+/Zn2+-exporting ATPase
VGPVGADGALELEKEEVVGQLARLGDALETADVVLMSDDLRRLPFAVRLARQAGRVIRQNLVIAIGVGAALIVCSIFGWTRIGQAVVLHEGSTLLVVLNGLRLLIHRD